MTTKSTSTRAAARKTDQTAIPEALDAAGEGLRQAASAFQKSLAEYKTSRDEALKRYSEEVDAALAHMNVGMEVATAQLKASRAETREELADALRQADESRKALTDQVKVQAHLGLMEARERSEGMTDRLGEIAHRIDAVLSSVRDDSTKAFKDLWSDTGEAIGNLRQALYRGR